ncbi:V-type proton ATPase subunit E [Methanothermococcus sp. Ax23]|uniref:V-type ATP synthase subunit E n=1 Tax=Methanothermococcus sp. Ax23 TaxID=3156486 RepID=UPI003BA3C319
MGADKITSKILDDAKKTADEIKSEAQREANSILEKAKSEAEIKKQNILKKGEKEAEMIKNRIIAEARLGAKKKMLEERENLINMAIEKLEEDLIKLPQKDNYKDVLLKLIIEGVISVGGGELILELNEKDLKLIDDSTLWAIEKEMEDRLKKSTILKKGTPANIIGGCIVKTADSLKVCDNSLESVFERNLESIRAKVAELLF